MLPETVRLGQIEPRERAGAQTGRRYEFQYERTARAALDLLANNSEHIYVYCDWHDDYVVELDQATGYVFHQVKGRKSSQGPWTFNEFFGVRKKKAPKATKDPPTVTPDAIVPRMLLHYKNFDSSCRGLVFVTNSGITSDLSAFLNALAKADEPKHLPPDVKIAFDHVARAYIADKSKVVTSELELFGRLSALRVLTDSGHLESEDVALSELADVIVNYSEIELLQRQAKQIAREIVSRVRKKVNHTTTVVPAADEILRNEKGIGVRDLLGDLSLSTEAYEQLKAGASDEIVKTLSRLQRYCKNRNISQNHLVQICEFKTQWDMWRTVERHFVKSSDFILLHERALNVLDGHLSMAKIVAEAKDIAKQFSGLTATPLTPEHVLGLLFSLAAQSEAIGQP